MNDTELACQETGTGDPVVFVHGGASDLRTWSRQFPTFGESFRTIVYSRRFARPNAVIPDDADDPMQTHVDDLAALILTLDAAPAHVVGHSWGGFVALLLAIQRPDLLRRLVLIEPPVLTLLVDVPPKPGQIARLLLRDPAMAATIVRFGAKVIAPATKAFRKADDTAAIRALGQGILGKERFRALSDERFAQAWDNRAPDRAQLLGAGFPPLSPADLKRSAPPSCSSMVAKARPCSGGWTAICGRPCRTPAARRSTRPRTWCTRMRRAPSTPPCSTS